jgi:hypothetical protein
MLVYPRYQRISNKTNRCTAYPGCCCIHAEGIGGYARCAVHPGGSIIGPRL